MATALGDLATQLGYTFEPGELAETYELEQQIWVLARGVTARRAAELISASGGVRVSLDDANRLLTVSEEPEKPEAGKVRAFKVDALCRQYLDYQKRYGLRGGPAQPDVLYQPTAAEELRDAAAEILQLGDEAPGSAVGKRLIYTRGASDLARLEELFRLMESAGESQALRQDRENREGLKKMHTEFSDDQILLSAVLWRLFKECEAPIYIDHSLMQSLDFEYDTTELRFSADTSHYDVLLALAREQEFAVDSMHGALRLHQAYFSGSASYQVFDVSGLLIDLEKQYAELKTDAESLEGFQGDLRSEGGVQVIVDALCIQLENAGCAPLVRAFGSRVVVSGGVDVIDRAAEVMTAMGWENGLAKDGERK
ncbi:MAG: hypothetical protein H6840_04320 [Planctomycetes bacterium]|nr:hypothetical protein [Planctomycetota bacterium]